MAKLDPLRRKRHINPDMYESEVLSRALESVKGWEIAVDAGAHYGFISKRLAGLFKRVLAFEIDPVTRKFLKKNMDGRENVEIQECGLGASDKTVSLSRGRTSFGTHISGDGAIPIRALDGFNLPACDLIKVDCEGYETHILRGAERSIEKFWPVVMMECKGHESRYGLPDDAPISFLSSFGYRVVYRTPKDCVMVSREDN